MLGMDQMQVGHISDFPLQNAKMPILKSPMEKNINNKIDMYVYIPIHLYIYIIYLYCTPPKLEKG